MRKISHVTGLLSTGLTAAALLAGCGGASAGASASADHDGQVKAANAPVAETVVANRPSGDAGQQNAIETHVRGLIKGAPSGSTIRFATYYAWDGALTGDLIAAHRDRNVNVQVVLDDKNAREPRSSWPELAKALGTDSTARSFVKVCPKGRPCIGAKPGIMHSKFWTFSTSGSSKKVLVSASANVSPSSRRDLWNSSVTLVGRDKVYEGFRTYFADLVRTSSSDNYYRTVEDGPAKAYFFPRAGSGDAGDTIVEALKNVRCVQRPNGQPTRLRVSMFQFNRTAVARQLWALGKAGCKIDVVYTFTSDPAYRELTKNSGKYRGPSMWRSQRSYDRNGKIYPTYTHEKYLLIEGGYLGNKDARLVFAGSHNYTPGALRANNEQLVRLTAKPLYDGYRANFDSLLATLQEVSDVNGNGMPDDETPPADAVMPVWLLDELNVTAEGGTDLGPAPVSPSPCRAAGSC